MCVWSRVLHNASSSSKVGVFSHCITSTVHALLHFIIIYSTWSSICTCSVRFPLNTLLHMTTSYSTRSLCRVHGTIFMNFKQITPVVILNLTDHPPVPLVAASFSSFSRPSFLARMTLVEAHSYIYYRRLNSTKGCKYVIYSQLEDAPVHILNPSDYNFSNVNLPFRRGPRVVVILHAPSSKAC